MTGATRNKWRCYLLIWTISKPSMDSLGHDTGDLLLKAVAERLLLCIRNGDTVARQGGDEFIVVLNSIAESLDAAKVAQKILDSLMRPS